MSVVRRLLRHLVPHGVRVRRRARRDLDRLFTHHPERLQGSSLEPRHRSRTQVLDVTWEPYRVHFGILRHPRPHRASRQFHEVLELWSYEPASGRLVRRAGRNLTRECGEDGRPASGGAGI